MENEWYQFLKKKFRLTDEDMEEYIDSFNTINNGEIVTPNVLKNFINQEKPNKQITINDAERMIISINQSINKKSTRMLDMETYLYHIIPICQDYAIKRVQISKLFDTLDTDKDGKITCDQLIKMLYHINKNFTIEELGSYKKQIKNLCNEFDTNGDGYISYYEFKKFMIDKIIEK